MSHLLRSIHEGNVNASSGFPGDYSGQVREQFIVAHAQTVVADVELVLFAEHPEYVDARLLDFPPVWELHVVLSASRLQHYRTCNVE